MSALRLWLAISGLIIVTPCAFSQTYTATVVEAIDGQMKCNWARDRLITVISGPCDQFKPPAKIGIGETFAANGKIKRINAIIANRVERDFPEMQLKAGDWTCTAAESIQDIPGLDDSRAHTGTWLYIAKCRPIE